MNNYLFNKRVQNSGVKLGDKAEILDKIDKSINIFGISLAVADSVFKLCYPAFKGNLLGVILCG